MSSDAAAPPFPDCWVAYGATNSELEAYGARPPLAAGAAWRVIVAQLALVVLLSTVAAGTAPLLLRVVAAATGFAVIGSATFSLLRLFATARAITPRREYLRLDRALGPSEALPWEQIGEIALAQLPTRQAVGLRLRPGAVSHLPAALRALQWRVGSDFDFLLLPADSDCEMLGRVLLRYCIDREARRRLPAAAA